MQKEKKKKKKTKQIIVLFIAATFLFTLGSVVGAKSAYIKKMLEVTIYPTLELYFHGVKDVSGDKAHPGKFWNGLAWVPLTMITDGTTYVPLRYVATKLGIPDDQIGWDPSKPMIWIGGDKPPAVQEPTAPPAENDAPPVVGGGEIDIYATLEELLQTKGQPTRIDRESEEIQHYVYIKDDYQTYVDYVIYKTGKVYAIISNAKTFSFKNVYIGMPIEELNKLAPATVDRITWNEPNREGYFFTDNEMVRWSIDNGKVNYLSIEDNKFEFNSLTTRTWYSEEEKLLYKRILENQMFDLVNAHRVKYGFSSLKRDENKPSSGIAVIETINYAYSYSTLSRFVLDATNKESLTAQAEKAAVYIDGDYIKIVLN